ncbi:hypothetical protein K4F52_004774 [Lecanicillium sp. MT-2017a]|nr:hypothetical protein K4F52_004774 [Lecanicillium sp. MT-2017a]
MFAATRALRQAAAHAERQPMIKFLGPRSIPSSIDHSRKPHLESPAGSLPESFGNDAAASGSRHASFSSYRDHAQQHGPLQKTIRSAAGGIGGSTGAQLGSVQPPNGVFFDSQELPARFRRMPVDMAEIEAVESGGAALVG